MKKVTLRAYLLNRRIELYEVIDDLKNKKLSNNFSDTDMINLEVSEAQLSVIKEVIEICAERHKY